MLRDVVRRRRRRRWIHALVIHTASRMRPFAPPELRYKIKEARKGFSLHARAQSTPRCTRQLNESK